MQIPPIVVYLALRTVLLLAVGGILALLGLRGLPLAALALLLSSALALPLLSRRRDAVSARLTSRVERTRSRLDEAAGSEDD